MDGYADETWLHVNSGSLFAGPGHLPGPPPEDDARPAHFDIRDDEVYEQAFAAIASCLSKSARQVLSALEDKWQSSFTTCDSVSYMVPHPPGSNADDLAISWLNYLASEAPDDMPQIRNQIEGQGPTRASLMGLFKRCLRASTESVNPTPAASPGQPAAGPRRGPNHGLPRRRRRGRVLSH